MKLIPICAAAALSIGLAAPALAQLSSTTTTVQTSPSTTVTTNVQTASGVPVTTGTGLTLVPGTPVAAYPMLPGGAFVQYGTQVMGGPGTTTTITRYWVNVPPSVVNDMEFQRWQALR